MIQMYARQHVQRTFGSVLSSLEVVARHLKTALMLFPLYRQTSLEFGEHVATTEGCPEGSTLYTGTILPVGKKTPEFRPSASIQRRRDEAHRKTLLSYL